MMTPVMIVGGNSLSLIENLNEKPRGLQVHMFKNESKIKIKTYLSKSFSVKNTDKCYGVYALSVLKIKELVWPLEWRNIFDHDRCLHNKVVELNYWLDWKIRPRLLVKVNTLCLRMFWHCKGPFWNSIPLMEEWPTPQVKKTIRRIK